MNADGTDPTVIELDRLTKCYGDLLAVDHVSLKIEKGEVFGLLGPNGAGKTTTIRMLVGLSRPSEGTARIWGHDIRTEATEAKGHIGVVPDVSNLYGELSGYDNLVFMAQLYGMPKRDWKERAASLLREVGLYERKDDRFASYSRGMKRRLTIAAALMHDPEVVFLDEPTTGLDVAGARGLRSLIQRLHAQGKTVFLTTHYIEEADQLCSRIAILVQGAIKIVDTPAALKEHSADKHRPRENAVLEVTLAGGTENALEQLRTLNAVEGASSSNGTSSPEQRRRIRLIVSQIEEAVPQVVGMAQERGWKISQIHSVMPSLEDAFVKLTGLDAEIMKTEKPQGGAR